MRVSEAIRELPVTVNGAASPPDPDPELTGITSRTPKKRPSFFSNCSA